MYATQGGIGESMKKIWKIMLVVLCITMLATSAVPAVSAISNDVNGAVMSSVSVAAGGSVKMNFNYSTLGDAEKVVVEVAGEITEISAADLSTNEKGEYVVTVPLSPDQMADAVNVYAVDAAGNVSGEKVYSIREYALAVLNNSSFESYHAAMRGLLNWGAMAGVLFNEGANSVNINKGIYAEGTNPVNGLSSFFEGEGSVSNGNEISVSGYEVYLEPGNTSIKFFFTYTGTERPTATVQKSTGTPVAITPKSEGNGVYSVSISNLGVAVFNKEYTVTVSAGSDSASVTKTMLEYLNQIAFEEKYTEAQHNLAKSMYQFYVQAMNVTVDGCAHATQTHKTIIGGVYCTKVCCSNCFAVIESLDHNMENGRCTVCGLTEYNEDEDWSGPTIGGDFSTPDVESLSTFNLDAYMKPIWDTNIVHNETVMFLEGETSAPLLYSADEIVAVRSYDLTTIYEEGKDYKLEDGKLVLLPGTSIPVCPLSTYYPESTASSTKIYVDVNGVPTLTMFGDNGTRKWQVAVTYTHSDEWGGDVPESYASTQYEGLINKLENGEDVTIFFYGDSITVGMNASGIANKAPYTPSWSRMFCQYLAKQYRYTVEYVSLDYTNATRSDDVYGTNGTIRYINTSQGGDTSVVGINSFSSRNDEFLAEYGCDLAVIAFGMNDVGTSGSVHAGYVGRIVDKFIAKAANTDILLVSTMEPNPDSVPKTTGSWCANSTQREYEAAYASLVTKYNNKGTNCAVAPMTTMSMYINDVKRFRDCTGNNINHPNDFIVRAYAQTVYQTVIGYEN